MTQRKKRLLWQLYPSYLFITLAALLLVSGFALSSLSNFFYNERSNDLAARAQLFKGRIRDLVLSGNYAAVDAECKRLGTDSETRLTVILPTGTVAGDTDRDPATMENHGDRPEVMKALAGNAGMSIRYSSTLGQNMMYVAIPVFDAQDIIAITRSSLSLASIENEMRKIRMKIIGLGIFVAVLAAVISLLISRRITRPIEELTLGAEHFESGDLEYRLYVPSTKEIGKLAEAMNKMATQLNERIGTESRQKNELIAVLSAMAEGVIALDNDETIISINPAAERFFNCLEETSPGKPLPDVVRNITFLEFVKNALREKERKEADILLAELGNKTLHTRTSPLLDEQGRVNGLLIVFNDVTTLRRLETMRRDFAANVSHEIKTPLTSIRGFVETILTDKEALSEKHTHFLEIIDRNVNRLMSIIEDLLQLSRIEKESREDLRFEKTEIRKVIDNALAIIGPEADKKGISVIVNCDSTLTAWIDTSMIEQAVINLVDNAVKYSEPGSTITLNVVKDIKIRIQVVDTGFGIEREHLPRLFERFYRTDKARSRQLGGTGLGLAIVKHIMLAHKGEVTVESTVGKGSVFSLNLPLETLTVPPGSTHAHQP